MNYKLVLALMPVCATAMAQTGKTVDRRSLNEGDLLFCVAKEANSITDVTQGIDGRRIDHVAIYHKEQGRAFALEAIHKGVCLTPIDSFLDRRQTVIAAELKDTAGVAASVRTALKYLGRPYDFYFMPSDSAMYCSELVQKSYRDKSGELVFKPIPMSFHDTTGRITDYWREYYSKQGLAVPEGEPGSNPGDLSRSDKIVIKGRLSPTPALPKERRE